jgi:Peptidase A4 family
MINLTILGCRKAGEVTKIISVSAIFTVFMCLAPNAAAQAIAYSVPTNLPGVTAATEPPAWFNPLTASDEDLAVFGFPPRPDAQGAPEIYKSWQRAMTASKRSIIPELQFTDIFHGPAQMTHVEDSTATSNNWSAVVVESGASKYGNTSFRIIQAEYVVPVASQVFGACTGSWDRSSSWVGIDGVYGSGEKDLFQAGTEADASCVNGIKSQDYYAWLEWVPDKPNAALIIGGLSVSAGDDIFIQVWNTSATQGYVYILNETTNEYVNLNVPAPSGTKLVGNSAEWVVERPLPAGNCSTCFATLTNYIWDYFSSSEAQTHSGSAYGPGSSSAIQVTMYSGSTAISYPTVLGTNAIQFQNEGPAR